MIPINYVTYGVIKMENKSGIDKSITGKMKIKGRKKTLVINIVLFGVLFGLVSFNKEVLRPTFTNSEIAKIFTGSFPNFIAGFIISLAFVNAVVTRISKYRRPIVYISSVIVFSILTFEEFRPLWGASTYYDLYDIIASGIGVLLSVLIFEIIIFKQKRKETSW